MTDEEHARQIGLLRGRRRRVYDLLAEGPKTQKQLHEALGAKSTKVSVEEIKPLHALGLIRSRKQVKHSRSPSKLWEVTPAADVERVRDRVRRENAGPVRVIKPEVAAFEDFEKLRKLTQGRFTEWDHTATRVDHLTQLLTLMRPMVFWRVATDDLPEAGRKLVMLIEWAGLVLADMDQRWGDDDWRRRRDAALALAADMSTTDGERDNARRAARRMNEKLDEAC